MTAATGSRRTRVTTHDLPPIGEKVDHLPLPAVVLSASLEIVGVNTHFTESTCRDRDELLGSLFTDIVVSKQDRTALRAAGRRLSLYGTDAAAGETRTSAVRLRHGDGLGVPYRIHLGYCTIGGVELLIGCFAPETTPEPSIDVWRTHAECDDLTGLYRRSAFLDRVRTRVEQGEPVTLVHFVVDDLEAVNDTHGHAAGDRLLQAMAERLLRWLPADAIAGRFAGDELAFAVFGDTDDAAMTSALSAFLTSYPVAYYNATLTVAVSIGAATRKAGESLDVLLARAGNQMFETWTNK